MNAASARHERPRGSASFYCSCNPRFVRLTALYAPKSRQACCLRQLGSRGSALTVRADLGDGNKIPEDKVAVARKFYEEGWSSGDSEIIDSVIAEDHVQADVVWQKDEKSGRESLKKGIGFIRQCYPDAIFAVDEVAPCANGNQVFVKWTMTGTFEESSDVTRGMALLTINQQNLINRTEVFRQATRAEVLMAERSKSGPVKQGVLL